MRTGLIQDVMRAGSLNEKINIYNITKIANDLGEMVKTNVLFKSLRTNVVYDRGNEVENNGQLTPMQTVIFKIRYDMSIKEDMLVEYNGKFYNIRYIKSINKSITSIVTTKIK